MKYAALLFAASVLVSAADTKPPAPATPPSAPKIVSEQTKAAIKDAKIAMLEKNIAILQSPQFFEFQLAQKAYNDSIAPAQKECGGEVDQNLNCVVLTAPAPKPAPAK